MWRFADLRDDAGRDVGLFRYWTVLQLPNFLVAAPVLLLSFAASYTFYRHHTISVIPFVSKPPSPSGNRPFLDIAFTPHIHLHTLLTLLLFFASHVQISLRLAITDPVIFWYAAQLVQDDWERAGGSRKWGLIWINYCLVWGFVAIALWAGYYPPA
jgi:phosphatidylinositol glycan class V